MVSSSSPSANGRLHPGAIVDQRYKIVRELGHGGMGTVYVAEHMDLGIDVALKVMQSGCGSHVDRLVREARAGSLIKHRNVVTVFDARKLESDFAFYVMELLPGRDLSKSIPMPWPRVRPLLRQVLSGLGAAHGKGIVHRDIKPANIMLLDEADEEGKEWVKVLDFGIAKLWKADDQDQQLTKDELLGTPAYMAPEVCRGQPADARTDLYAVGIVAFQLITGMLPFRGSPLQVLYQHLSAPPPRPRQLVPSLPPAVDGFILRALAKEPADRFPSATAMIEALDAIDDPLTKPKPPTSSRRRWLGGLLGVAAAGVVIGLAISSTGAAVGDGVKDFIEAEVTPPEVIRPAPGTASRLDSTLITSRPEPTPKASDEATAAEPLVPNEAATAAAVATHELIGDDESVPKQSARSKNECQSYECRQRRAEQALARAVRRECRSLGSGETVEVRLRIGPDGAARMPQVVPPHDDTALGRCVEGMVAKARFPPPEKALSSKETLRFKP